MKSKKVLISADIFLAFLDRNHIKHLHAAAFFRYFAQEKYFLYTSPIVIADSYTLIAQRISPILAKDFIKAMASSSITTLMPDESDMKLSYKTTLSSGTSELSFDEILLATMATRRGIPYICTFSYWHQLFGISTFYLPI